jgi:hypothetical protein
MGQAMGIRDRRLDVLRPGQALALGLQFLSQPRPMIAANIIQFGRLRHFYLLRNGWRRSLEARPAVLIFFGPQPRASGHAL